jgi:hypothetical protein
MAGKYGVSVRRKFDGKNYQYYSGYFMKNDAIQAKVLLHARGYLARIIKTNNGIDRPYAVYYRSANP